MVKLDHILAANPTQPNPTQPNLTDLKLEITILAKFPTLVGSFQDQCCDSRMHPKVEETHSFPTKRFALLHHCHDHYQVCGWQKWIPSAPSANWTWNSRIEMYLYLLSKMTYTIIITIRKTINFCRRSLSDFRETVCIGRTAISATWNHDQDRDRGK